MYRSAAFTIRSNQITNAIASADVVTIQSIKGIGIKPRKE
jgi:Holliday junction resolvasome RuvABC DNA-binding subunit